MNNDSITNAIQLIHNFRGANLTQTIRQIENSVQGIQGNNYRAVLDSSGARADVLDAARLIKQVSGQIDVVIHTLGILLCLPHILLSDEIITYTSLGAGNAGKTFDLETDRRVAEFKFIHWQGGAEAVRQNQLFKDLFGMAESETTKDQ
jgi:hypothetical protein